MEKSDKKPDEELAKQLAQSAEEAGMTTEQLLECCKEIASKKKHEKAKTKDPVLVSSTDEAMFQFDFTSQLVNRLIEGTANPEYLEQTKAFLGEARFQEVLKQVEEMPAEQKKAIIEYSKAFK